MDLLVQLGGIGRGSYYYDPSAFTDVTDVRFGTSGRNIVRNPGMWNTDLMIDRTFKITERINTSFRGEFYNLPNTSHFTGMSSTSVTSGNFMRVLSSTGERQIRFGLRLAF